MDVAANEAESVVLYNFSGRELPILASVEGDGTVVVRPAEPLASGMYSLVIVGNGRKQYSRVLVR